MCNRGGTPDATGVCVPIGVAVDDSGNLYVADQNNSRVLEYDQPSNSGQPAHLVFGQTDSTSIGSSGCDGGSGNPDGLCLPQGVAVDDKENLYVADRGNSRVLRYDNPLASEQGTPGTPGSAGDTTADVVFGHQGSFSATASDDGGISADSLSFPAGVAVNDTGDVFVADTGNNRVLEYGPT